MSRHSRFATQFMLPSQINSRVGHSLRLQRGQRFFTMSKSMVAEQIMRPRRIMFISSGGHKMTGSMIPPGFRQFCASRSQSKGLSMQDKGTFTAIGTRVKFYIEVGRRTA
eukprot:gnl/MRDRNA2_/MRDRNA2_47621_c0_seq1.p1 gnl/MRDRNA2_/MRDRNA2_47621_c0~~gnl/MRDRNA2_/MRDRNA2_47621_c0_seq1.p1  ORF type:complete len:129 (-),score=16.83 gnl/MRDRNA2_/MRDRNA2_47621_c0_seq1:52-381(-)